MRILKRSQCLTFALLFLLAIAHVFGVAGQSGRRPPPETLAARTESQGALAPDPNRDEYQVVFTKGYQELKKGKDKLDLDQEWQHYVASFIDELNRVGAQGYRVTSLAVSPRLAVLRRSDHQYEYALIPIVNRKNWFDGNAQFGPKYLPWARKGFRVAEYVVLHDWCASAQSNYEDPIEPIECTYISHVLLERKKNSVLPHRFEIVYVRPTLNKDKLRTEVMEELDPARKTDLYPTHMLTRFQFLMQSTFGTEDFVNDDYEVEMVTRDMRKTVNQLAQQGYRLVLRPHWFEGAIMHRRKGVTIPASYIWINQQKLEQELPRLKQQGAIYRMSYGCSSGMGYKPHVIFEQPSVTEREREYKILKIELKELENVANHRVEFLLTPESKSALQTLNSLAKEGFQVRDFFDCHVRGNKNRSSEARLLMERVN